MTRKDYIILAEALKKGYEGSEQDVTEYANTVYWVVQALKKDNPNFREDKFNEACGL